MSNDLLGDENEVKLDPEVAASAFPELVSQYFMTNVFR